MANRPALVSQTEVKRTVAGALDAGLRIGRIEVCHRTGKVVIYTDITAPNDASTPNPWDKP